ncbi:acetyl-CoA synthetase-like protein [Thozetella sp. PMI_491]|nr:acetyl-CoA synthetase-like protein [Thozetella sp. PMI_491]
MANSIMSSELLGEAAIDVDKSYWSLFFEAAEKHPEREAVVSLWQNDPNDPEKGLRWTYADILRLSEKVAQWLASKGCRPGQTLAAFLENSAEWALFLWATARLGMTFVPLDPLSLKNDGAFLVRSVSPSVIVLSDQDSITTFQAVARSALPTGTICISSTSCPPEGWVAIQDIINAPAEGLAEKPPSLYDQVNNAPAIIFFTSGTTGVPKGCAHEAKNIWSATWDWEPPTSCPDRWLLHTPVSHVLGCNHALRMFRAGGTVVFPSRRFNVDASLFALKQEKCTKMAAVPTLVRALLANKNFPGKDELSLVYITMGATLITPEDIRTCKEGLGAKYVVQGFGMTEGMPLACWKADDPLLAQHGGCHPGVGKVLRGANLRICEPGSTTVLGRNQVGELHAGGTSVISGYLHGVDADKFYDDKNGRWIKTGDQAIIDDDGVLHILGRYKDLIIRGGENIAPAKIEAAISEIPGISVQVVGCTDSIAGQVPVAVINGPPSISKAEVREKAQQLGSMFALDGVYWLKELGLDSFPVTSINKIKKQVLRDLVESLRSSSSEINRTTKNGTQSSLVSILEDLLGQAPGLDDDILTLADSITVMRYCDRIFKTLELKLYLQDVLEMKTIREQAGLLMRRKLGVTTTKRPMGKEALDLETVVFANGDLDRLADIKEMAFAVLGLHDLSLEDVEALIPIKSFFHNSVQGCRPQSWHHRMVIKAIDTTPEQVRAAIVSALQSRQNFRALFCLLGDGTPFHVIVKLTEGLLNLLIREVQVEDSRALEMLEKNGSAETFSSVLMFRATIISMPGSNNTHILFDYNHSVFDIVTLQAWYHDLDVLLENSNAALPEYTPFKWYADMAYMYDRSPLAQISTQFYVRQLQNISTNWKQALWPPQKAPGWIIGRDTDSSLFPMRDAKRKAIWGYTPPVQELGAKVVGFMADCPALDLLRTQHAVPPKIVVQTAVKLFNIHITGQPFAFFTVLDDARRWPFVPDWIAQNLPPAASVAGPTIEGVMSITHIDVESSETVAELLMRVADEWSTARKHAQAPWPEIYANLGNPNKWLGVTSCSRQSITWDSSLQLLEGEKIKSLSRHDWPDCGVFWNGVQIDADHLAVTGTWDTAQMSEVEFTSHVERVGWFVNHLTRPDNLGRPLREVFQEAVSQSLGQGKGGEGVKPWIRN